MLRFAVTILTLFLSMHPLRAAETVDLALVLAVDVSRSVDAEEYALQKQGYTQALTDPRILNAIRSGPNRSIAVTYVEWSDYASQKTIVDWSIIADEEGAQVFTTAMQAAPRSFWDRTSISGAIDHAVKMLQTDRFVADRRVIDVSGDGVNNSGRPSSLARDEAVRQGITINGLVIINDRRFPGQRPEPPLDEFYMDNVIGGVNSFVVVSNTFADFATAVLSKLIKEIAGVDRPQFARLAEPHGP